MSLSTTAYISISVLGISFASLTGVILLSLHKSFLQKILLYLVSFATGALFANVFFHILPEVAEQHSDLRFAFGLVLLGLIISFFIEKFVHWHHCHNLNCSHTKTVGTMVIIGDGVHNITDGILIATAYLVDIQLGMATTIAILLHEIPQEIGDFAVLMHSGFSRGKALLWNLLSAFTAFIGAFAVIFLRDYIGNIEIFLLPIVGGNFLYIAGSDLIPELHKESRMKNAVLQLLWMLGGIALIYSVTSGGHSHHHEEVHTEHEIHDEKNHENEIQEEHEVHEGNEMIDDHDSHNE